jgi:hypothetical protein
MEQKDGLEVSRQLGISLLQECQWKLDSRGRR